MSKEDVDSFANKMEKTFTKFVKKHSLPVKEPEGVVQPEQEGGELQQPGVTPGVTPEAVEHEEEWLEAEGERT